MVKTIRFRGCFWLLAVCFTIGCGKSDSPGGSPGIQPVAAQEQQKPDSVQVKEEPKAAPLAAGGEFKFADDVGGKILGRILPPAALPAIGPMPIKRASERTLPSYLSAPDPSTVPSSASPRQYPQPPRLEPRPTPLNDRIPFDLSARDLERPEAIVLPVGGLTKIDPLDVARPSTLPILARPTADRAPLEDPTTEFTARSIINENLPLRVTLSLFAKVNLPDPFENTAAAKVAQTIPDDPASALGNPPSPRP